MDAFDDNPEVDAIIEAQITKQGAGCIAVSDGHVLVLTADMLAKLTSACEAGASGRVVLFIKRGSRGGDA